MLNRFWITPCALLLVLCFCDAEQATGSDVGADEVSCLQSLRPNVTQTSARHPAHVPMPGAVEGHGTWPTSVVSLVPLWSAKAPVILVQLARRLDGTDTTLIFILFGAVLLCFFALLACFAQLALKDLMKEDTTEAEDAAAKAARKQAEVPFVQPGESLKNEALPAMCSQFMSSMHQPYVVPLKPIQDSDDWTLKIYSQHSKRVLLSASLLRAGTERKRSCIQVRNFEKDQVLGTITSSLEILVPDGRTYGRLVAHRGEYLLQEASGRDARLSMAEDEGTISAVWLPPRGTATRIYQDLKDGLHRLGKRPVHHSHRGHLLATMTRPDGSNGHRLELVTISGVDAMLILLCSLGLVTFNGIFDIIDQEDFKAEKAGQITLPDPSPAVNSSFSTGTSSINQNS